MGLSITYGDIQEQRGQVEAFLRKLDSFQNSIKKIFYIFRNHKAIVDNQLAWMKSKKEFSAQFVALLAGKVAALRQAELSEFIDTINAIILLHAQLEDVISSKKFRMLSWVSGSNFKAVITLNDEILGDYYNALKILKRAKKRTKLSGPSDEAKAAVSISSHTLSSLHGG